MNQTDIPDTKKIFVGVIILIIAVLTGFIVYSVLSHAETVKAMENGYEQKWDQAGQKVLWVKEK